MARPAYKATRWRSISESKRFWMKVQICGPTECWPWIAGTAQKGYGRFRASNGVVWAHRWVLEQKLKRPIRPDKETLHSCDNKRCCNPRHVSEGTRLQNIRDTFERGIARPGGKSDYEWDPQKQEHGTRALERRKRVA